MISVDEARALLSYDPETGVIVWRVQAGKRRKIGQEAGCIDGNGYRIIRIARKGYKAHRIAWLLSYGVWPTTILDHTNGVKSDNRISNLREVTAQQNSFNKPARRKRKWKGITWDATHSRWRAMIIVGGIYHTLGSFSDEREAAEAYLFAALQHHGDHARI